MLRYRILTILLSPIIFGHILWLSIKNKNTRYFFQRLGFDYSALPTKSLWFHCASVGEVNTLLPLIKNIHDKDKQLKIIITTNTTTGAKIVAQQKLNYLFHSYLPFDWAYSVNLFLKKTKPASLYVMETEIWPNLFNRCHSKKIAITLINARLSKKSTSANNWIKSLLKSSLSKANAIYTRTEKDKNLYITIGADKAKVSTTGNLKLTTTLINKNTDSNNLFSINREYVLLASTHKKEELQFYKIWKALNRKELLIIAPRHPERSAKIIRQLECLNIAIRSNNDALTEETEVYLLDTIGELNNYFSNAKLVIMGGSFVPIGGHNILEPASFNSAIITGPHMENFKEELKLMLSNNAIGQVSSFDNLTTILPKILDDDNYRSELKNNTAKITHDVKKILDDYTQLIFKASRYES